MIARSYKSTSMLSVLLVVASYQIVTAQALSAKSEHKAKAVAAEKQTDQSQSMLTIPQATSGCTSGHGPSEPCGRWVCLTGDNSWEDIPLKRGTKCINNRGQAGQCNGADVYSDDCIVPVNGAIYPSYYIASVIYAPPGTSSSVDYGAGSTIGTITSTTDSWKNSLQVQLSTDINVGLFSFGLQYTFGTDWGGSTTSEVDVEEKVNSDVKVSGSGSDSIDHNYDWIVLLLGPEIDVVMNSGGTPGPVQWGLNFSRAVPQVVLVGWLNGAMTMPSDVATTLSQYGITTKDYSQILGSDPFASDSTGTGKPDPARFTYATVYPYEPISGQFTYALNNSYASSINQTATVNYTVGASVSPSILGQSPLKVSDTFTWGNSSSQKASTGSSETETVVLSMPSSAYTGPTDLYVYVDTIYKTFLLSFVSPSGTMTSHYSKRKKQ